MSFFFKSPKNLDLIQNLKYNSNYLIQTYQNKNKSSFVPFLSHAEKLVEKIDETPGPGQYNLQNPPDNYIHKQYIKKNIEQCKDNLNNTMNFFNNFGVKIEIEKTPGPGYYNPGENINFGAKAKKINTLRKTFLFNQNEQMLRNIRNIIYFNNLENEKTGVIKDSIKDMTWFRYKENLNNNNININFNPNKTKKYNPSYNNIFKRILFAYSKIKEDTNPPLINDKESLSKSFSQTFNLNNSNSELNTHTLKKSNSSSNSIQAKKAKIFKTVHDHERIKKISEQKKSEMNENSDKSIYYLEKYLNSKMFAQSPGPGYYFYKQPSTSNITRNNNSTKKSHESSITKIIIENKEIENKLELNPEKPRMKKINLSKTINNLKSNLVQQDLQKVKEALIRNKYKNYIQKLIKAKKVNKKNNNKEIQSQGYPIKYNKIKPINNINKNNIYNFNAKEKRFIGPSGWENEIIKNVNPGPGEYDLDFNTISNRYKNIIILNLLKGFQNPKDKKSIFEEINDTNPPVGIYQPQIVNSIDYKNRSKAKIIVENPLKDGFKNLYQARTKKRVEHIKYNEKLSQSMLSPLYYNNMENKSIKKSYFAKIRNNFHNVKPINKKKEKENIPRFDDLRFARNDWIKKTFNASFV